VRMPGMSGLALHRSLGSRECSGRLQGRRFRVSPQALRY
jgi:hypothetical protein